jgi:hypothetical protein
MRCSSCSHFFYDKYLIHQNKLDLMRDYEFIFDRFSSPLLTRLSPYIMQYFRVYIQRHEELTTQCCDEIWKCDHKKIKQKKMLMKIQSCVYDGGSKSWDQQPSKSQMDFYVSFHNLMFQFLAKKKNRENLFYHQEKVFAQHWSKMRWREKEASWKFSSCFFLFPYGVLLKSSLKSFLSCCWKIIDKINWQYKFNLCQQQRI